ncbi:DUF2459 domain-containing protein [Tropicibacter sp. Alg240-R139]|uniref:DUF2459 domain-containing protein n=1 Tax=Tropicibacter sp. Alg240-R139 TaxID=2305991 RepID=UPI0013DF2993
MGCRSFADPEAKTREPLQTPHFTKKYLFFPTVGHFNLFRTFNTGIGQVLREAGSPVGLWVPLPVSVTLSHRGFLSLDG